MSSLGETELRILSLLEELGSEWVPMLINMTLEGDGREDDVASFQIAARNLLKEGYVDLLMVSQPAGEVQLSLADALAEVELLPSHLLLDASDSYWADDRMKGPPHFQIPAPQLAITGLGQAEGERVLEERGVEWWSKRK